MSSLQINFNVSNINKELPFGLIGDMKTNEITLKTKKLVSDSNNYNEYIQKFYNHTKLMTYKLPLIQTENNLKKKKINSNGYLTRTNSIITNRLSEDFRNINHTYLTPVKSLNGENIKNLKNLHSHSNSVVKKLNFRVQSNTDLSELAKRDEYLDVFTEGKCNKSNNMFLTDVFSKLKMIENSSNLVTNPIFRFNSNKTQKLSVIQQISENYFNIGCLDLEYDEKEIFHRNEFYKNLIKEKLFYGEENKTRTKILERVFNAGSNKETSLLLHPIEIEFRNLENNSEIKNFKFVLPFELLPIFHFFDIENFKYVLLSSLRFSQNLDHVVINEEDFFSSAKILLEKQNNSKSVSVDYFMKGIENIYKFMWITSINKFELEIT
jgi:hypothetical protein